jgi:RecA-family ATPase
VNMHDFIDGAEEFEEAPKQTRFPRVWLDDVAIDLTNADYIKHLISPGAFVLTYGPSGHGKTFFTMDMCAHIATGQEWRGKRVRPCLVV